jgi:hypothetical protein
MNLTYAKWLKLPIQKLPQSRKIFNVDGTMNKSRDLQYYTDLEVQTGSILSRLGTHYLCGSSEGLDDRLEVEVINKEEEVGEGKASKAKDDGSKVG